MAEKLDNSNFYSFVQNSEMPVLVDFYSDGCIPCRRIAPLLNKAESEYGDKLKFAKVNIGANTDLIAKYSVEAAPTLIAFKDSQEVNRLRGAVNETELKDFINKILQGE